MLPIYKSDDKDFMLHQTRWASELNPILTNPLTGGILLRSVTLTTGVNQVNHRLGRKLQGWMITRLRGPATIYDQQDTNLNPDLTLTLNSSAGVVVDLYVF